MSPCLGALSNREDSRRGAPRANEGGRSTGSATIKRFAITVGVRPQGGLPLFCNIANKKNAYDVMCTVRS